MKSWSDPEVIDEVAAFYRTLDERAANAFDAAVERLTEIGPTLGRPTVAEVDLSRYPSAIREALPHLKELRPAGTNIRVLFTFGPDRVPVLLVAGDKTGEWNRWYPTAVGEAARLYREYLRDIGAGG